MPENRQVQKNAAPNQSASDIEETFWRLKINDHPDGEDVGQSNLYPERPGEPDCLFYLRTGLCGYGSNCRYNHPTYIPQSAWYNGELPERAGKPDCEYFLKTGTCKFGSSCKYHHPRDRHGAGPVTFNILGLPIRQEEKPCPYYMRTGSCKFGAACKFHHPQPTSLGTLLPLAGSAALGSTSSVSSGTPYFSGSSTWSLPRMPYITGPQVQGQEPYMPVLLSFSQGIMPAQAWNTYMGNISPTASPTVLGSNLVYNSRYLGEFSSNGQLHMSSTSNITLPERPDQPECHFFMNTGTCKFGSGCKFHHPKDKMVKSAINPIGLPSRSGQAVCSNYSMYGICKFGPSCKFDHPFAEHPYNYGFGLPALSVLDSPLSSYPRNISRAPSSEASPSTSSKSPEWVQKVNGESNIHQNSNTRVSEDNPEQQPGSVS